VPTCGIFRERCFIAAPDGLRNRTEADWLPSKPMPSTLREGFMSQRNGDKARFDRQRKKKFLHRKRIRELRKGQALQNKPTPAS
jgi:hypothetical protein